MDDIPINKLSDQIKNFNYSNHKFIQDPNFSSESISSMITPDNINHDNKHNRELSEESLFAAGKISRPEIKDERFKEKMLKDAFKYLYYTQKLKHVPEYKQHLKDLEEIDHNILIVSLGGTLYGLFMIFKLIDNRMTYYDKIDDIIRDKPRKFYIQNKPFHFGIIISILSIFYWNLHYSIKLEKEYQDKIRKKYLSHLKITEKHPKKLFNF